MKESRKGRLPAPLEVELPWWRSLCSWMAVEPSPTGPCEVKLPPVGCNLICHLKLIILFKKLSRRQRGNGDLFSWVLHSLASQWFVLTDLFPGSWRLVSTSGQKFYRILLCCSDSLPLSFSTVITSLDLHWSWLWWYRSSPFLPSFSWFTLDQVYCQRQDNH